jgi:NAD+ synthase (glutamine-hydrolysing)
MKIGILQQNYVVGDCAGNARKIFDGYTTLCQQGVDLVVGSELAVLGYPPQDLLEMPGKVLEQFDALKSLNEHIDKVGLIIGAALPNPTEGKSLFNSAIFIRKGGIVAERIKELLPTYDVFDERRHFEPGHRHPCVVNYLGKRIGILLCEDIWGGTENPTGEKLYSTDPVEDMVVQNPDIVVVVNASPYYWGKGSVRYSLVSSIAKRLKCLVVYVNQVGGNDELIFDGRSFAVNAGGICIATVPAFEEGLCVVDTDSILAVPYLHDEYHDGDMYDALVLGTQDYLRKTGYTKVVIGESGGIDSALVTCIAVDAIGAENVTAIGMPSEFSSSGSVNDARELCLNLGVRLEIISIADLYDTFGKSARGVIGWGGPGEFGKDVTQENVQARLRGMILMAYSNRKGALVLSTGNKSEMAMGYCTLYGDMVGGLSVISDVLKTWVYRLSRYVNDSRGKVVIPLSIIEKPPSAELRPDQKDQDSLPPYDILDVILKRNTEEGLDYYQIVKAGSPPEATAFALSKIAQNEYKRRQAAPGLKVTPKAFGPGRRMPIATKPRSL